MKEKYSAKISKIHASQELINSTLEKIHQEENKIYQKKTIKNKIIKASFPMVAAIMIFFVTQLNLSNNIVYNKIPNMSFMGQKHHGLLGEYHKEKVSVDEYKEYINLELDKFMSECKLKMEKIEIKYQSYDEQIIDDEGIFTCIEGKIKTTIRISKNKNYIPQETEGLEISKYCGRDVLIVTNKEENMIIAVGKGDKVSYYFRVTNLEKSEFENKLKKILKYL